MSTPPAKPTDLAQRLADPAFRAQIEEAVASMPAERAAELVYMLEASLRRRKIELIGYLAAAVVLLLGMVIAIYLFGRSDGTWFVGWVFLVPLAAAGLVMMFVGRLARVLAPRRPAATSNPQPGPP